MTRRILIRSMLLGLVGAVVLSSVGLAEIAPPFDYHYSYDPQSQTFTSLYDPNGLGAPSWTGGSDLTVPNIFRDEPWHKDLFVQVSYVGGVAPTLPPGWIMVTYPGGGCVVTTKWAFEHCLEPEGEIWTGEWNLPEQPYEETIQFGDGGFRTGMPVHDGSIIDEIELASHCVPEASSLTLLCAGAVAMMMLRRRRHRQVP